jgi:DNA-binding NtrC family response regulator
MAPALLDRQAVMTKTETASILLVDDDVELLKALTKVLERAGYEVVPHTDARSAIECVSQTKRRFDLVITDMFMPGMRGTSLLTAFKTAFPTVPVVVITAFGDWGQYAEVLQAGALEYLSKPLDKSELLAVVRRALAGLSG